MTLSPAPAGTTEVPVTPPEKAGASHLGRLKGSRSRSQAWAAYLFLAALVHRAVRDHDRPDVASLYLSFTDYNLLSEAQVGRPRQLRADVRDDRAACTRCR